MLKQFAHCLAVPEALPPGRVLGCGTGEAAVYLARLGWKASGFDAVRGASGSTGARRSRRCQIEFVRGELINLIARN